VIVPQLGENGRNPRTDVLFGQDNTAWRLQGTTRFFAHAAFVPLTAGTIVALEHILRNCSEWEE
jgi:hypothetical protein